MFYVTISRINGKWETAFIKSEKEHKILKKQISKSKERIILIRNVNEI